MAYADRPLRPGRLEVGSAMQGTTHLITLAGELDLNHSGAVDSELLRAESSQAQRIVVDLSELEFIDSSGISLLVAAMRRSEADSDRLRFIASHSEDVQRLFKICGLDDHLPFIQDG